MPTFMIRYRIRDDARDAQDVAVRDFVAAIRAENDPSVQYSVYVDNDGVSFTHHAWMADEEALQRFQARPYFKPFAEGLKERCIEGPAAKPVSLVVTSAEKDPIAAA